VLGSGAHAQFHGPGEPVPPAKADLVVENARIHTPGGWAQSMAVADVAIVALGSRGDVSAYVTAATRKVDAGGRLVVPGLYDMQVHPMGAGLNAQNCALEQGSGPERILATIRECASAKGPGEWGGGNGHDNASFGDTPPHRVMLDAVSGEQQMLFFDISGIPAGPIPGRWRLPGSIATRRILTAG
jgi:predicted amidohydrolase YtcJ